MAGWCVGIDALSRNVAGNRRHLLLQSGFSVGPTRDIDAAARHGRRRFACGVLGKWTSQDTLGAGAAANAGVGVNATVDARIPDIRRPWKMKVSSIEGGVGLPGFAVSQTYTPRQIADWINKHLFPPAMDPQDDELSPFARTLRSENGGVGANIKPAIPFLSPQEQNPLGGK